MPGRLHAMFTEVPRWARTPSTAAANRNSCQRASLCSSSEFSAPLSELEQLRIVRYRRLDIVIPPHCCLYVHTHIHLSHTNCSTASLPDYRVPVFRTCSSNLCVDPRVVAIKSVAHSSEPERFFVASLSLGPRSTHVYEVWARVN